jgi:glycosyltransferase involved in cell wall biosynthesis
MTTSGNYTVVAKQPSISVIIPVYNGRGYLEECLDAMRASSCTPCEIIVVDDASTDDSGGIAHRHGATVLQLPRQSGPAAARNYAAQRARGEVLFFVDADVVVNSDAVARVARCLAENADVVAVFGSYDDNPAAPNLVSQFRNLLHHFVHQHSRREAKTFWAGCGAIRREIFHEVRGFDAQRYPRPSVEDIELGLRIAKRGYRILLDKELQAKHLKCWGWRSWLKTDISQRAIPWSQLILETARLPSDLNLQVTHRASALLVGLLTVFLFLLFLHALSVVTAPTSAALAVGLVAILVSLLLLNHEFYAFLRRTRGIKFLVGSIPLHFLYYFYSGVTFSACWILHKIPRSRAGWTHSRIRP